MPKIQINGSAKGPGKPRTHQVAGKDYVFTRAAEGKPLVCDVKDDAAAQVFLAKRNANLFSLADEAPLTRASGPKKDEAKNDAGATGAGTTGSTTPTA
jgi:hypothetical protein